jgi:NAD(P)-dependent dehydrogenase (short-subunit alcohol dehydrogenase family)
MSYASVESAAEAIEKEFGKLDILINNAGYLSTFEPMGDTDPEDYWRNYEINLRGVYFVTRACLPLMLRGGEKTIVNVSSRGANTLSAGASGYQTTKFALLRFTEFLVVDYGEQDLLAFAVHPASSKTELAANVPENLHQCEC